VTFSGLDQALSRLDNALGQLEAAARRRLEVERGRANLEAELTLMQDDRARLAVELDGTMARLGQVQGVAEEVDRRIDRAMTALTGLIETVEARPDADDEVEQDA
jgi:chromosome segregation ATPase